MHAAPPVRMTLAPDTMWSGFVALCAGLAAANFAVWTAAVLAWPLGGAVAAAALAAVSALALAGWARRHSESAAGELAWDGAAWSWTPASAPPIVGEPRVSIDLGAWILLRFTASASSARVRWLAPSRRQAGAAWPVWRAALFAPRPSPETAPAEPA
jgi:hypothetical protein